MPNVSQTIKQILQARDAAEQEIFDKISQLGTRRETIKDAAYGRVLTAQELAELKDINSALGSLDSTHMDLMLMTVQALNISSEVKRFANVLDAANQDLTAKLKDVQQIAANIKRLNAVFQKITAVITTLTKLLALIA